jgi:hypothetical protein
MGQVERFAETIARNTNKTSEEAHREAVKMAQKVERQKKEKRANE